MTPALRQRLSALLRRGQKIQAIALYRKQTGAGLREAKRAVEALGIEPVSPPAPAADSIWMTTARQGFFSIPADVELPVGTARLVDAHGRERLVDPRSLRGYTLSPEVARAVLGDEATRPGRSAEARAHRARLDPKVSCAEWIRRLWEATEPLMNDWQRTTAREYLDVGEDVLAVECIVDWLEDEPPCSPSVRALMSDTLVALGLEPLHASVDPSG